MKRTLLTVLAALGLLFGGLATLAAPASADTCVARYSTDATSTASNGNALPASLRVYWRVYYDYCTTPGGAHYSDVTRYQANWTRNNGIRPDCSGLFKDFDHVFAEFHFNEANRQAGFDYKLTATIPCDSTATINWYDRYGPFTSVPRLNPTSAGAPSFSGNATVEDQGTDSVPVAAFLGADGDHNA